MSKPFLFLYGNCQMGPLANGLGGQPEVERLFEVRKVPNFKSFDDDAEPGHAEQLAEFEREAKNAKVLIYQAEAWDKNSSVITDRLSSDCVRIPIFSVAMSTLWPFYFKDMAIRKVASPGSTSYFPYGDTFLTRQVKAGADCEDIVRDYLALDVNTVLPLDDWRASIRADLRRKEETAAIRISDHIEERFETERCFWTLNHATHGVFRLVVGQLLAALGLPDLDRKAAARFSDHIGFGRMLHHPVHPSVIEHFKLTYLDAATVYKHYDDELSFEDWVRRYVATSRLAHGQGATPTQVQAAR